MSVELDGEERILAPIDKVWASLNDPEVLRGCIPGCESLELSSPTKMVAVVTVKIGPIKARFNGEVTLTNINAPSTLTINGEGKGGLAGFAKGGADVELKSESDDVTILHYVVKANVGGKLAQLGSRLIVSTSKKLSGEFFTNLNRRIGSS